VGVEDPSPSVDTGSSAARPADGDVSRDDDIRGDEHAAAAEEAPDQRRRDPEGWVGHHLERPPRKPEIGRIDLHHRDGPSREPPAEVLRATRMELDGDDTRADVDQLTRERAGAGADIEDQVARIDPRRENEAAGPAVSELMPSPAPPPSGGHGAP
jgi:hypothetical protein